MSSNTQKPASSAVIEVGDIFKIEADEENGITPPLGRLTWYKHFGKAEGRLLPDDLAKALELVKLSPRNGPMVLRMYNIVKF